MVRVMLWVFAAAAAAWAHRAALARKTVPVRGTLVVFAAGAIAWRLAEPAATLAGGSAAILLAGHLAAACALWAATIALVAYGVRRREAWVRGSLLLVACALGAAGAPGVAVAVACSAVLSYRWRSEFTTRPLLRLALAALVLLILSGWKLPGGTPPAAPTSGTAGDVAAFAAWAHTVAITYLVFGFLALCAAFVRDPGLGIRTVSRRLTLSHVLVVGVPLLLVALLWLATTVLGVNLDRAAIATRAVEAEGDALAAGLGAALDAPDGVRTSLPLWAGTNAAHWPRLSVWTRRDTAWSRAIGPGVAGDDGLAAWTDSLGSLPGAALVTVGDSVFLGAAVRSADAARAAVALVPASTFLPGVPARLAGTGVGVSRGESTVSAGGVSIQVEPDSTARRPAAPRAEGNTTRVTLNTGQDTFLAGSTGVPVTATLLGGHSIVRGIAWRAPRWVRTRYLLSTYVAPAAVLAGLVRSTRQNPMGLLPLVLLSTLTALVILVAAFDIAIVANMGRSITTAIRSLRGGTERLQAGDLAHRIRLEGDDDLWDVAAAFNAAAAGLERARVIEQERNRFESELAVARQIQARLLPASPPHVPGLEIAGLSESAREVGGDYFDHVDLGDGRALLVIADVSGKGVPAALLMSGFRASLMSQDLSRVELPRLAERLNEFMVRSVQPGRFVTAFVARLDGGSGRLEFVNAGHNPPVLLRAGGAHELLSAGGLILGIQAGAAFERGEMALESGDLLTLYTDGVTEGADARGDMWGEDRLIETLRRRAHDPCTTIVGAVAAEVRAFEGERGPADDVTLLAARRAPV